MKMGKYKEASHILNELLRRNPKETEAFAGIGVCFDKLGKSRDAQRYYRKFLQTSPLSSQAQFIKSRLEKLKTITCSKVKKFSIV